MVWLIPIIAFFVGGWLFRKRWPRKGATSAPCPYCGQIVDSDGTYVVHAKVVNGEMRAIEEPKPIVVCARCGKSAEREDARP